MDSPLLFPVRLGEREILVLDETKLPFEEVYIKVSNLDEALKVLKEMKTRALGQVLLFFYSCVLFTSNTSFDEIARLFKNTRPTFDFVGLGKILEAEVKKGKGIKEAVDNFVKSFDDRRRKRAEKLALLLPDPANILTICNVSGELLYLFQALKAKNKSSCFYVTETRPYLQGTRLTFWELRKNGICAKLICDNQAAVLFKEGKVNCVVVGSDRSTLKGDIVNKIGTYALARLANIFFVPFYALVQYPADVDVDSIEIEERNPQEVFAYIGEEYKDIEAIYPSFDITKAEFITERIDI